MTRRGILKGSLGALGAALAAHEGRPDRVRELLERAVAAAAVHRSVQLEAAAKHRLGELLAGDEGAELVRDAEVMLGEEGVEKPARFIDIFAPGLPGSQ